MYMDDVKVSAKNEKELENLVQCCVALKDQKWMTQGDVYIYI